MQLADLSKVCDYAWTECASEPLLDLLGPCKCTCESLAQGVKGQKERFCILT